MRLLEAAKQLDCEKEVPKSIMASSDLGISKAVAVRWLSADEFFHMKVDVDKLPLMAGDILASGEAPKHLVIVDINKNKVNRSASYLPKVTVICGADIVRGAKKNKTVSIDCWISAKAAKCLKLKLPKMQAAIGFNPNPITAPNGATGGLTFKFMKTGMNFPDAGNYGAPGSELNNPQFMSMLNIEEALSMYLSNLKNGIWKPISSQWTVVPPSLRDATNEAGLIAKDKKLAASFVPMDFVLWQKTVLDAPVKHKYVDGVRLSASKFAFVGDVDDPSTWLFRADSLPAIKNALVELKACAYISTKAKALTLLELKKRSGL
jgi:hypothetical protein